MNSTFKSATSFHYLITFILFHFVLASLVFSFQYNLLIQLLPIYYIILYKKTEYFFLICVISSRAEVEVLDDTVCLHNTNKPHGLMQFKLRLMQAKGYNIILVNTIYRYGL